MKTETMTRHYMLEFLWTVSRGRDTYGYNICSLYVDGFKKASCNGGGYDMRGTSLGNWIASEFKDSLLSLKESDMPEQSHWERAENPRRRCDDIECFIKEQMKEPESETAGWFTPKTEKCPKCQRETRIDYHDGKQVIDGHYFYGLTFHDPNWDPGKAVVNRAPVFGTDADAGKTVEELEKEGKSLGLERYQAFYSGSSKHPTDRHTIPSIDGGCGFSSVEKILRALGYQLQWVKTRSTKRDVYICKPIEKE